MLGDIFIPDDTARVRVLVNTTFPMIEASVGRMHGDPQSEFRPEAIEALHSVLSVYDIMTRGLRLRYSKVELQVLGPRDGCRTVYGWRTVHLNGAQMEGPTACDDDEHADAEAERDEPCCSGNQPHDGPCLPAAQEATRPPRVSASLSPVAALLFASAALRMLSLLLNAPPRSKGR